jgi:hypothetical protein
MALMTVSSKLHDTASSIAHEQDKKTHSEMEIQDGRQEGEAGADADIGVIRAPRLIEAGDGALLQQIRIDAETVIRIGRVHEGPPRNRLQAVLLHHPPEPFGVDDLALTFQFLIHLPVPVAGKLRLDPFDAVAEVNVGTGFALLECSYGR